MLKRKQKFTGLIFSTVVAWIMVQGALVLQAKGQKPPEKEKPSKVAEKLDKNLALLNQWGKLPDVQQGVYKTAFNVLASKITASYADVARDAEFQKLCEANGIVHLGGPMLGCVSPDGAKVWLRTVRPAKVEVRVMVDRVEKSFGPVESTFESDLSAVVSIAGLKPETRYSYRVLLDGKPLATLADAAMITAPDDAKPGKVRIAFGSCFHQWGLGNGKQADLIVSRKPSALLVYGDVAVQDREHHVGYHRADFLMRDFFPAWQRLVASVPVYADWDDHDYFNNDKSGIPPGYVKKDIESVWGAFRSAWNNPSYGFSDDRKGIFFRTRIGSCDVIMTDSRYFRKPAGEKGGTMLGDDQMKWLEDQLLACKGPFIILESGTMWSDYVSDGKDSWGMFDPAGRERIFSFIEKNRIPGVLLISGDRHGARGFRIPRPSGYEFYEFEPASLGGRKGPPVARKEWTTQLFGIENTYAFGEFSIDAMLADPEVTFRLISEDAKEVYKLTLKRSQLTPKAK
jgi:alkaline phosphatase D